MTWMVMKISCHKSMAVWLKLTPNSMTIPCHLSRFYLFSMLEHDMDFGKVQVMAISMAFAKKMMGFPVRIWSHFGTKPSCRQKDKRKSPSHFVQGILLLLNIFMLTLSGNLGKFSTDQEGENQNRKFHVDMRY